MLGKSEIDFEYPLRPGVAPNKLADAVRGICSRRRSAPRRWAMTRQAGALLQQAGLI